MGEVVPFQRRAATLPKPRILVLSDTKVNADTLCDAFFYARPLLSGIPDVVLSELKNPTVCVSCTLGVLPSPSSVLHYFTRSAQIKVIGVVCLMSHPPRVEIEDAFPGVQIFFQDPNRLRAMAQYTSMAR
jgi:hypothetical protein